MNERLLRTALLEAPVPAEAEAVERAWEIVGAAFRRRAAVPRRRSRPRLALAIAAILALVAALALTPAGAKVTDWIRDVIEPGNGARPALTSLPAPGRLLVTSGQGAWVVGEDGSKRRLGDYHDATWSPNGLFIAVARGRELTAVQPDGTVRWSLGQAKPVSDPAWAPSGIRIAYRAGRSLHVVEGDGNPDRVLDPRVAPAAPAWNPGPKRNLLAYVDSDGSVHLVDVETSAELWRSAPFGGGVEQLDWSADGHELLVLGRSYYFVLGPDGAPVFKGGPTGAGAEAAAFSPTGDTIALARRTLGGTSELVLVNVRAPDFREHRLLSRPGHFTDLAWSPDGNWLLVPWRDADAWLFVRPSDHQVTAYSDISQQFAPGSSGPVGFPRPAGWCCTASP